MSSLKSHMALNTPALVYDAERIIAKLRIIEAAQQRAEFDFIYSIKSASFSELLKLIQPYTQGFSTSSYFESKWVKDVFDGQSPVHFTSPGLSEKKIELFANQVDVVSFNSWSQFKRLHPYLNEDCQLQIRINPKTHFSLDERYDPCRQHSKLGVTVPELLEQLEAFPQAIDKISGIHIHNNCESRETNELFSTVEQIVNELGETMQCFSSINLGGGYLFNSEEDLDGLVRAVEFLKSKFDIKVIFEPGKAIVGEAGYLLASVIDLFDSDGLTIAILDTTVNHLPELFEYQRVPLVSNVVEDGPYRYRLAGCSCLSGDIFGDYYFAEALQIGSQVIMENIGAYMFVKANMFNGIQLPDVYLKHEDEQFQLIKTHDYEHYRRKLG